MAIEECDIENESSPAAGPSGYVLDCDPSGHTIPDLPPVQEGSPDIFDDDIVIENNIGNLANIRNLADIENFDDIEEDEVTSRESGSNPDEPSWQITKELSKRGKCLLTDGRGFRYIHLQLLSSQCFRI